MKKTAIAHANIALVKYWGKRENSLNLPAVGSISMTLKDLFSKTSVEFREDLESDIFILNGKRAKAEQEHRMSQFLDLIRQQSGDSTHAEVVSENNFPTGAGLASSASGFAALAVAATEAMELHYSARELSQLARQGSGSAARSIFGGFVEMKRGEKLDGSDVYAIQLKDERYWQLDMLILITAEQEKEIGSTEGMTLTARTSPYYPSWVASSFTDLSEMRKAITEKDFQKLGEIAEFSCLKLHGLALSAKPGLLYWNGLTVNLVHQIRALRKKGVPAFFTIDAGPQVKVLCPPEYTQKIKATLQEFDGIKKILHTTVGPAARIVED